MADRTAKTALFDEFARAAKALASGRRIELLDVLANGERTVEVLASEVGLTVANASQHLQVLRQAGLVATRREGTWIYYSVEEEALEIARDFIDQLERSVHTPHEADYCPPPS